MSKKYELINQIGERLEALCTSWQSHPPANLTWWINEEKVKSWKKTAIIHFLEGKPVDEMNLMQDYWMAALWKFDDDIIGLSLKEQRWQSGFYGQNYRKIWVSWDHLAVIIQECWKRENIYILMMMVKESYLAFFLFLWRQLTGQLGFQRYQYFLNQYILNFYHFAKYHNFMEAIWYWVE